MQDPCQPHKESLHSPGVLCGAGKRNIHLSLLSVVTLAFYVTDGLGNVLCTPRMQREAAPLGTGSREQSAAPPFHQGSCSSSLPSYCSSSVMPVANKRRPLAFGLHFLLR